MRIETIIATFLLSGMALSWPAFGQDSPVDKELLDPYKFKLPTDVLQDIQHWVILPQSSPDKSLLVVWPTASPLTVHDAKTGATLWNYKGKGFYSGFDFSPDSKSLVVSDGGGVYTFDSHTGKQQSTYSGFGKDIFSPAWSPDGKYIACASERSSGCGEFAGMVC